MNNFKKILYSLSSLLLVGTSLVLVPQVEAAGNLSSVSVLPTDSRPSQTGVGYAVGFTLPDTSDIKCIQVKFATSVAMTTPATGMTSGSGFSLTGGGLTQGNWSNYGSTSGTLQIDAASAQTPTATAATITWTGVTNTSITNPTNVYAQVTTYATNSSHSCSDVVSQSAVMALLFNSGLDVSVTVDPTLTFTVANYGSAVNGSGDSGFVTTTSTSVPFGTVAAGQVGVGSQTLTTSTNAAHGYTNYIRYTQQLTDANSDTIRNVAGTNASPAAWDGGSSQSAFGYTVDGDGAAAQFTSNTWAALTTTNAAISSNSSPASEDAAHVEYKVEPSNTQAPGTYTTTVIYTAVPMY